MRTLAELLDLSSRLDVRFHLIQDGGEGGSMRGKEQTVLALARLLTEAATPYAVIGGLAVQFHSREPRTTLDVDLALLSYDQIPVAALQAGGFRRLGRHTHSEKWQGPDGTPVQFTADPLLADAVRNAEEHPLGEGRLRIATSFDLVRAKLRAAADPGRRRSKRLVDLADAVGLCEETPGLRARLTPAEQAQLDRTP